MRSSRRSANSLRNTGTFGDFAFGGGLYIVTIRNSSRPALNKQLRYSMEVYVLCFETVTEMVSRKIMATPPPFALAR